jgi:hypothetical protein
VPPADAAPAPAGEVDTGARAQLRVRADMIDRLVNEAGEVAIARARVEGELRSLKSNLLELTGSVIRLRSQVREIEIQAESQIQSRMSLVAEAAEGFDPLEFDRYTRFQELTRSLAEGVNDVSTVQQSLLKNLDDADAALVAQARLSRDVQQQLFSIRTVPFGSLSERLYRIMRATAKELDQARADHAAASSALSASPQNRGCRSIMTRSQSSRSMRGIVASIGVDEAAVGWVRRPRPVPVAASVPPAVPPAGTMPRSPPERNRPPRSARNRRRGTRQFRRTSWSSRAAGNLDELRGPAERPATDCSANLSAQSHDALLPCASPIRS